MEQVTVIKDSSLATSLDVRVNALIELAKKLLGNNVKIHVAISDADQKHVDFLQDCGHDSSDDYSVRIHGEDYKILIESKDKPMPF